MPNFGRGGEAAREEAGKKQFGSFKKVKYLSLKDKESITIRLIDDSDEWPYVYQHSFVPTKGAPPDWQKDVKDADKKKWPTAMGAVCRKQKNPENGELVFPEYDGECFICDHMENQKNKRGKYFPSVKLWARALVREEVRGTQAAVDKGLCPASKIGKIIGFRDKIIDEEQTDSEGKVTGTRKVPEIIVINQSSSNFFGAIQAVWDTWDTVLDRDFKITRRGEGLETEYDIVAMDPMDYKKPILDETGAETGEFEVVRWSLEDPEIKAKYDGFVNLEEIISEQASDQRFDTFFDTRPGHEHPASKKNDEKRDDAKADRESGVGTQAPAAAPAEEDVDAEDVAAMRDRLFQQAGMMGNYSGAEENADA
jgi:hypothetical protein